MRLSEPEIEVLADAASVAQRAAEEISGRLMKTVETKASFSIALSGGSTPRGLYALLARDSAYREGWPWDRMHFFWGDERHVPPDHEESNYRMAHEAMLSKVPVPPANIHRVRGEDPDPGRTAQTYELELFEFFNLEEGELPQFDCMLLGMGPDGHTASLFPGTDALKELKHPVVANWVEKFQTHRITMTLPAINNADLVVFLVAGEEKAQAVKQVLEGNGKTDLLPAQLIRPTQGRLLWLVDEAAARLIT